MSVKEPPRVILCPECHRSTGQLLPAGTDILEDPLYACTSCRCVWLATQPEPTVLSGPSQAGRAS
jgi:hypothetical protein